MNRDLEVFVDGANVTLPHSIAQVVEVDRVSSKKIEVTLNATGVTVIWSGRRLKIKNPNFHPTHGLFKFHFVNALMFLSGMFSFVHVYISTRTVV